MEGHTGLRREQDCGLVELTEVVNPPRVRQYLVKLVEADVHPIGFERLLAEVTLIVRNGQVKELEVLGRRRRLARSERQQFARRSVGLKSLVQISPASGTLQSLQVVGQREVLDR